MAEPKIRVYAFFNGVPKTVGYVTSHGNAAWAAIQANNPGKELYMGHIVERHELLGYTEETTR